MSRSFKRSDSGLPVGAIVPTARDTADSGYLLCDGAAVSRTTYARLFDKIGTAYGAGDGTTTFNVPDLQERVPVGASATAGYTRGSTGGADSGTPSVSVGNHTLTTPQIPAHSHSGTAGPYYNQSPNAYLSKDSASSGETFATDNAGGSGAHSHSATAGAVDVRQRFVACNFQIRH